MGDVLVVTGPCGVGKTSVAFECMEVLEERGVPAAMVDAELTYFHPKPAGDLQGERVAEAGLAALWPIYREAGIRKLLLARVIEKPSHVALIERAVHPESLQIAWLDATSEENAERIGQREIGSGLAWHLARAAEIRGGHGQRIADFSVDASRNVREIALDILRRARWI